MHAFVLKTPKGSGMPEIVAENLTQNSGGRYDVMNTTTALPEKMKALGEQLALDHRNMSAWYEVDIQTDHDRAQAGRRRRRPRRRAAADLEQPPGVGVRSGFPRFATVRDAQALGGA